MAQANASEIAALEASEGEPATAAANLVSVLPGEHVGQDAAEQPAPVEEGVDELGRPG